MAEKYGFVYIWFDRKHHRYYIGSHWGNENDGYICSSNWMRDAYRRRPEDFKRRIIKRIYSNRQDTFIREQMYLNMIKEDELKIRYYNLNIKVVGNWASNEETRKTVSQKIAESHKGKRFPDGYKPRTKPTIRAKHSDETKEKMRNVKRSDETKEKIRLANLGKRHSEETKRKMREARKGLVFK